ncbi:MAG: hypothetical protein JWO31_1762 [Phycisphaerales bacterium]|nr:hypothetical protein [Phycisphaerales bacterium]
MTATNECDCGELLSAYHDGELSADRAREVAAHLEGCPTCAAELADLRRFSGTFRVADKPIGPAPDEWVDRLTAAGELQRHLESTAAAAPARQPAAADPVPFMRLIPAPPDHHARRVRVVRWLTAAAASVGLLATAQLAYHHYKDGQPANRPGVIETIQPGTQAGTQPGSAAQERTVYGNQGRGR